VKRNVSLILGLERQRNELIIGSKVQTSINCENYDF